ncbi:MAG TPA: metabolite traffic protein EboE [Methylomirabilota bacterium]|nr:metabolite traffic protein EboE [Methylomirabilota bacterium]
MRLNHSIHLAYCTNIHRGETWAETFQNLKTHTLAVRDRVAKGEPFAIGLRLGVNAASELKVPARLGEFRAWLDQENCYVFTINGFPYGQFHGTRVKEQVYAPDWTTRERVEYTMNLFDILAEITPAGVEGSVSTVPCSYKEFITSPEQERAIRQNLWEVVERLDALSKSSGKDLHLGLEPEPLCYLETSAETVRFFQQMRADRPEDDRIARRLGVNYDACHLAVEFEKASEAIEAFRHEGIRLSKLHFSSALKVVPTAENRQKLKKFIDPVYFHQVIEKRGNQPLRRIRDLDDALAKQPSPNASELEWRIHFHVPLHHQPEGAFGTTADHLRELMDELAADPRMCSHIEMETYTWEVLPEELKRPVVDSLVSEYEWTLGAMRQRGLAR